MACDELEVAGCTDETACNYDELATDDDGTCEYAVEFYDCEGNCLNDADEDGVCDELEVEGCTNVDACNYDELATEDDGSCPWSLGRLVTTATKPRSTTPSTSSASARVNPTTSRKPPCRLPCSRTLPQAW